MPLLFDRNHGVSTLNCVLIATPNCREMFAVPENDINGLAKHGEDILTFDVGAKMSEAEMRVRPSSSRSSFNHTDEAVIAASMAKLPRAYLDERRMFVFAPATWPVFGLTK